MFARRRAPWVLLVVACFVFAHAAEAQDDTARTRARSITDTSLSLPAWPDFVRVLSLREHNTRVVVIGTTLLGAAAGIIGTFAYLRRRALMGDALSHATLPGIAAVFLIIGAKNLPLLILGATASGVLGVLTVIGLRNYSRLKEDAAIGIVLSVFFGFGMVLFSLIQQMNTGDEAGLQHFIYGKAAALLNQDAWLIAAAAALVVIGSALFFKEFRMVCFDPQFAGAQGFSVLLIDLIMMALVVTTTVVGLQAVGLILIVALLIVPPAAARFWTDRLGVMTLLAGVFGGLSGWLGATLSALLPRLPTGAIIVLCAGLIFFISMFFSPHRGIVARIIRHAALRRRISHQHLLRALAEHEEEFGEGIGVRRDQLLRARSWSPAALKRLLARAERRSLVVTDGAGQTRLTGNGRAEAQRILRNHRLWELYLIHYADIAPSHVDRDADEVEHILSEPIVRELEGALNQMIRIPPSPHAEGTTS